MEASPQGARSSSKSTNHTKHLAPRAPPGRGRRRAGSPRPLSVRFLRAQYDAKRKLVQRLRPGDAGFLLRSRGVVMGHTKTPRRAHVGFADSPCDSAGPRRRRLERAQANPETPSMMDMPVKLPALSPREADIAGVGLIPEKLELLLPRLGTPVSGSPRGIFSGFTRDANQRTAQCHPLSTERAHCRSGAFLLCQPRLNGRVAAVLRIRGQTRACDAPSACCPWQQPNLESTPAQTALLHRTVRAHVDGTCQRTAGGEPSVHGFRVDASELLRLLRFLALHLEEAFLVLPHSVHPLVLVQQHQLPLRHGSDHAGQRFRRISVRDALSSRVVEEATALARTLTSAEGSRALSFG